MKQLFWSMLCFPFEYLFISPSPHFCFAARGCLFPPPWIRQVYSITSVVPSSGGKTCFVDLKICMALLNFLGQGNLKIIVSCKAPWNFNMSSYRTTWIYFIFNSMIFSKKYTGEGNTWSKPGPQGHGWVGQVGGTAGSCNGRAGRAWRERKLGRAPPSRMRSNP